ncbi:DUF1989 domain-containing protein [Antrihabitans stalactiti]|uniref:DUF1989 domain-containing protein n=1 Tax=Antrihabitans stalactiti TaxID=2584121 RepID=A0A848KIV0_9NOCA|nr:DUF1989 domain-containing protein [Antrihabitans stalactiti]
MTTASTAGARQHARSQAAIATVPKPATPDGIDESLITWSEVIPPAGYATKVLGRGTRLRLRNPAGGACAHVLLLRAGSPWERLNVADTVKVPWQAYLGVGHPLLSDQGRVLATIVADTAGTHDTLCGTTPQARELLARGGTKHGLTVRDIGPTISFFRGVRVDPDGGLRASGNSAAGTFIDLLIHLPVIVLVTDAPHPLDERPTTDLEVIAWGAPGELSTLMNDDPEYQRAVQNTEEAWGAAQNWGAS